MPARYLFIAARFTQLRLGFRIRVWLIGGRLRTTDFQHEVQSTCILQQELLLMTEYQFSILLAYS